VLDAAPLDPQARSRAVDRIDSPGTQVNEVSSSLPSIQRWTAYLNDSVTVLGADATGRLKAALVVELDPQGRPLNFVWGTAPDLRAAPSNVMNAIARDFHGTSTPTSGTSAVSGRTIRISGSRTISFSG
jgi:hypothetical protein